MSIWKDVGIPIAINPLTTVGIPSYLDYLGSQKDRNAIQRANDQNIALQREFAQSGIQWRVEDARKAGINPLAALGASGASFSANVMPATSGEKYRIGANFLRDMGQNVSRAAMASQTAKERLYNDAENQLRLEKLGLENELLRSQITNINKPSNPAYPASVAPTEQLMESIDSPGHFFMMPSMEAAMASQGDYIYPLTNRLRKTFGHYSNMIQGNETISTDMFPMPSKYADQGYDIWKRQWDGMIVPAKKKDYGTKNW